MTECWTSLEDFKNGLVAAGGTPDTNDYVFAGGGTGAKLNYFHLRYCGTRQAPGHKEACVCSHKIVENCYIEHKLTGKLYVIGNHCIKRFMHGIDRTCTFCGTIHKNRKDNMCAECRKKHVFINVTFVQKEDAKQLGARWNPTVRMWWVHPSNTQAIEEFGRFI